MHQHHQHIVEYASDYLVPGVALPAGPGFHQITLTWDQRHPDAEGSFFIDPNTCGLDQFGDPTICTKIAVTVSDMKLRLLAEKLGHRVYTIEIRPRGSTAGFSALPLHLVTIAAHGQHPLRVRLLVVNADQPIERIIELHQQYPA